MSFAQSLETGLIGEGEISKWFTGRGYVVLPAYEVEMSHGKGPRIFSAHGQLIAPDLLVFNSEKVFWIEAKTKSAFTWHRISGSWQTGIDRRHWHDYLKVNVITPFPIWILFLHRPGNVAKDTPEGMVSPSGLFGNTIESLELSVDHEHENHGPSGMVYWRRDSLKLIAAL
jgi:hypothetical protein